MALINNIIHFMCTLYLYFCVHDSVFTAKNLVSTHYHTVDPTYFSLLSTPFPLVNTTLFSVSRCLCLVCLIHLYYTYKWHHTVFVFLHLTYFTWHNNQDPFTLLKMAKFHLFYDWVEFHCIYVPHFLHSFHQLIDT